MAGVLLGIALGEPSLAIDRGIGRSPSDLPLGLTSTVASARALLSTIAGATITFAGIAFSISLLTIQLASSQYSPRVVHTLFRDPFNRRVMALVVGTFTYCVVVLRAVRSALDDGAEPLVSHPTVCVYLLEALHLLVEVVTAAGLSARAAPLEAQAELVLAGAEAADLLPADLQTVRRAHAKRFGTA